MENVQSTEELISQFFAHGPIYVGKWVMVFAVVILSFVIILKFRIADIFDPCVRLGKKVAQAKAQNHVIEAKLIKIHTWREYDSTATEYTGDYQYELGGKVYKYPAANFDYQKPPEILHLYYDKTPQRLFTDEKITHYRLRAIPMIIINLSPFIIGGLMVRLLGLFG